LLLGLDLQFALRMPINPLEFFGAVVPRLKISKGPG